MAAVGTAYLVRSGKIDGLIARGKGSLDGLDKKQLLGGSPEPINSDSIPNIGKSPSQIDLDMVSKINCPESERDSYERKVNCAHTATSYILNSVFGMDTIAKGHNGIMDEESGELRFGYYPEFFSSMFDGIKITDDYRNQYSLNDLKDRNVLAQKNISLFNKIPNRSTGILYVTTGYQSHYACWEKDESGVFTIVDPQCNTVYSGELLKDFFSDWVIYSSLDFSNAMIKQGAQDIFNSVVEGFEEKR